MVSEQVNLIHETPSYAKTEKSAKSLHTTVEALHDTGGEELHQAGLQEAVGVGHSAGHHHHAS